MSVDVIENGVVEVKGEAVAEAVDARRGDPGPATEDEREDTLRAIFEAENAVAAAHEEYDQKAKAAKGAKQRLEDRIEDLRRTIREASRGPGPLFKRVAEAAPAPGGDGEDWRLTPLSSLGIRPGVVEALIEAGIGTLGDLADFTAAGESLESIKGLGPAKVAEIEDAVERFWASRAAGKEAEAT